MRAQDVNTEGKLSEKIIAQFEKMFLTDEQVKVLSLIFIAMFKCNWFRVLL